MTEGKSKKKRGSEIRYLLLFEMAHLLIERPFETYVGIFLEVQS